MSGYYISYNCSAITPALFDEGVEIALEVARCLTPKVELLVEGSTHKRVRFGAAMFGFVHAEELGRLTGPQKVAFEKGSKGILPWLTLDGCGEGVVKTQARLHDAPFRALLSVLQMRSPTTVTLECSKEGPRNQLWDTTFLGDKEFEWYPQYPQFRSVLARTGVLGRFAKLESSMPKQSDPRAGLLAF